MNRILFVAALLPHLVSACKGECRVSAECGDLEVCVAGACTRDQEREGEGEGEGESPCAGSGGEADPGCPACGERQCNSDGTWGSCVNGSCDFNSFCNTDGSCACEVDECSGGDFCVDSGSYSCALDAWGCGSSSFRQNCTNGCSAGSCINCDVDQGDACGATCNCGAFPAHSGCGQMQLGEVDCSGTCVNTFSNCTTLCDKRC